ANVAAWVTVNRKTVAVPLARAAARLARWRRVRRRARAKYWPDRWDCALAGGGLAWFKTDMGVLLCSWERPFDFSGTPAGPQQISRPTDKSPGVSPPGLFPFQSAATFPASSSIRSIARTGTR